MIKIASWCVGDVYCLLWIDIHRPIKTKNLKRKAKTII